MSIHAEDSQTRDAFSSQFFFDGQPLKAHERWMGMLSHLLGVIPLWGVIFDTVIWLYYRLSSRPIVFQAQQALIFQLLSLVLVLFALLAILAGRLVMIAYNLPIYPTMAQIEMIAIVAYCVYSLCCLIAVMRVSGGHFFLYPFLGRRLLASQKTLLDVE